MTAADIAFPVTPQAAEEGSERQHISGRKRWRMSADAKALTLVTAVLIVFGLAVLYSASAITATIEGRPGHHYVVKQLTGVLVGLAAFAAAAKVDADQLRRLAWPAMIVSILLMAVILRQGSAQLNNSQRFVFGGSLQPSEIAKFAVILWTSMLLVKKGGAIRHLKKGLLPFVVVIGLLSMLAVLEPDFSVALTFCLLAGVLLFVANARLAHFVFLAAVSAPLLFFKLREHTYVLNRIGAYFSRAADAAAGGAAVASSDQQLQSLIAIGSGGLTGVGFGQGNQQRGWLPLVINDFTGSVIGEEFGFLGILFVVLLFTAYAWLGFRIARNARSPFTSLLALGLTFVTVFTAFIHMGVALDLLPNTGLTLPFISSGRSNLVLTLAATGVIVNIGSRREMVHNTHATDPLSA